jgi:hypothetical protein
MAATGGHEQHQVEPGTLGQREMARRNATEQIGQAQMFNAQRRIKRVDIGDRKDRDVREASRHESAHVRF